MPESLVPAPQLPVDARQLEADRGNEAGNLVGAVGRPGAGARALEEAFVHLRGPREIARGLGPRHDRGRTTPGAEREVRRRHPHLGRHLGIPLRHPFEKLFKAGENPESRSLRLRQPIPLRGPLLGRQGLELPLEISPHREIHVREFGGRLGAGARHCLELVEGLLGLVELLRLDEKPQRHRGGIFGKRPRSIRGIPGREDRPATPDGVFEELRRQGLIPLLDRDLAAGQPPRHGHRTRRTAGGHGRKAGVKRFDRPAPPCRKDLRRGTDILGEAPAFDDLAPQRPAGAEEHLGPLGRIAGDVGDELHEAIGVVGFGSRGDHDLRCLHPFRLLRPGSHDQRRHIRTPHLGGGMPGCRSIPAELLPSRHRDLGRLPRPLRVRVAFGQKRPHGGGIVEATGIVKEVGEQGAGPVEVVGRDTIPASQRPPQSFHGPRPLDARCLHGRRSLLRLSGRGGPLRLSLLLLHRRHGSRCDIERRRERCSRIVVVVGSGTAELLEQGARLAGEIFVVARDVRGELLGIPEHARLLPLLIGRKDLRLLRKQLRRPVLHPQPLGIEPVGRHVQK